MQRQARPLTAGAPSQPQGHDRVAFFPNVRITRKCLKTNKVLPAPVTLGEHIKAKRLTLGLLQQQVAERLGVCTATVVNWEKNQTTTPPISVIPAVVAFLGYDPSPAPDKDGIGARMASYRRAHGLSINQAAKRAGVDEGSWRTWEKTGCIPTKRSRARVEEVLYRDIE